MKKQIGNYGDKTTFGGRSHRRALIREEAAKVFADRGYNGSSLQEVADAMGFTKAAVYYYYPSKEALLFDILSYADDQIMAVLDTEIARRGAALEQVERIVSAHVAWYLLHPNVAKVVFRDWSELSGEWLRIQVARRRRYSHLLREAIERCATEGFLPDGAPITLMTNFINGAVAATNFWFDASGQESADAVASAFGKLAAAVLSGTAHASIP
ncbi:TetR/AcrR family transcriptional regulator [Sphingorhabdus sp.]|jgi:AcrR family transcriptional regulator|uniref:TetR/AcrR family transcriptional regulator n=1 Tax=Sphingorhabdus sp. TaxID=1902408 RepID=UPI0037CC70AA